MKINKWRSLLSRILLVAVAFTAIQVQSISTFAANDFTNYADALNTLGVFQGTNNGYELDRPPTRLEGLILFIKLLGEQDDLLSIQTLTTAFDDVPAWGSTFAEYAHAKGYTSGIGNRQFGSNQEMQANSYVTYLLRALGYDINKGDFQWVTAIEDAVRLGVLTSEDAATLKSNTFTRGHVALLSYKTLEAQHVLEGKSLYDVLKDKGKFSGDLPKIVVTTSGSSNQNAQSIYNEAESKARESKIKAAYKDMDIPVSSASYYVEQPNTDAPFKAGVLNSDFVTSALDMINLVRMIAYLPTGVEDEKEWNTLAQNAALSNYVNDQLSHYPAKPEGMSDSMYALASNGAKTSNLYYGKYRAGAMELRDTFLGYMDDSDDYNIKVLGHRRWLLHPNMETVGIGYITDGVTTYSAIRVFDDTNYTYLDVEDSADYVAWPSSGAFPTKFFEPHIAWSVSLNNYVYDKSKTDEIQVILKNESSGMETTFTQDEIKLVTSGTKKYFNIDTEGYGVPFTIIFRPDDYDVIANDVYSVHISGLYKLSGEKVTLEYATRFFDM